VDGSTDIYIRRVGKDRTLHVGRGHAGDETILIFVRSGKT